VLMGSRHKLASRDSTTETPMLLLLLDGGPKVGFGHVGRCLALWDELEDRVAFAVEDPDIGRLLDGLGVRLAKPSTQAPVVLLDRRAPAEVGQVTYMRAEGRRVCLLDDAGEARGIADLVIDPPTGLSWPPAGGRRLAGFEHVLLRRDVREAARRPRADVQVLLSMGGSDPESLTPALAQALKATGASVLTVLGLSYQGQAPVGDVLDSPQDWPRALAGARLLVGRFGHTMLEAAHLGTPSLVVATSERASEDARRFASYGTIDAIRINGPDEAGAVTERALELIADTTRLAAMATRGRELVDGHGAARVAAALRELV
jgi:spore coat polysaccharide biosynthesis predicted glycosyltransferase SpsG